MKRLNNYRHIIVCVIFTVLMIISFGTLHVGAYPFEVWVSPEYDENTQGWGETHFANIQDALGSVSEGCTVIVGSGTYYEHIVVDKGVTIRAENHEDPPVIDGGGSGTILFLDSPGVSLESLTIQNGDWGIWIASSNNTVRDCTIRDCDWRMVIPGYGNKIVGNNFEGQTEGIMVGGSNNVISDNIVLGEYPIGGCTGLRIAFSSHNIVKNNYFENYRCHILITGADHNIVAGNTIFRSWDYVEPSEEYRNSGIILYGSQKNTIINNDISDISGSGIRLFGESIENVIQANKMERVGRSGLEVLFGSNQNEIINNMVAESTHGVILDQVDNNLLYKNIFYDIDSKPFDNGENYWSWNGMGNYWGEDHKDTIMIPSNGEDDFPLKEKPEISVVEMTGIDFITPHIEYIEPMIIDETEVWEEDFVLEKPIIIRDGGVLDIRNAKVEMMDLIEVKEGGSLVLRNVDISVVNQNLMNLVIVYDGGELEIRDSILSARGQDIIIKEGGKLWVEDSELIGMGHWDGGAGLDLRNSDAVIVNNTIRGGFVGILIDNSNNHKIKNNEISDSATGILLHEMPKGDTVISGNNISNMIYTGIFIQSHPYYTLENNLFENIWGYDICGWGIGMIDDDDDTDTVGAEDTHIDYSGFVLLIIIAILTISVVYLVWKKRRCCR